MKRFVLMIALLLSLPTFAQDNFIFVATGLHNIRTGFSDRHPLDVCVSAASSDEGKTWAYSLVISVKELVSRAIPKGGLLLIRTASGEVIELRNEFDEAQSRDFSGAMVPGTSIITYSNKGSYAVTLDQLRLLSSGVQKVRIEFSGEHVDSEYKKDKWGDPMALMLDEISQKTATNNVREGF
jgi:hypothetical protein